MRTTRQRLAIASRQTNTDPSEAQKKQGNYAKGWITIQGLPISIENPRGSMRSGTGVGGRRWEREMPAHYGYIRGTKGKDGDHVDVIIGPDPDSGIVYVIDQVNAQGIFDEHKCCIGFLNQREAERAYLSNYPRGWKLGKVTPMPIGKFKAWLKHGNMYAPCHIQCLARKVVAIEFEIKDEAKQRLNKTGNKLMKRGFQVNKAGRIVETAGELTVGGAALGKLAKTYIPKLGDKISDKHIVKAGLAGVGVMAAGKATKWVGSKMIKSGKEVRGDRLERRAKWRIKDAIRNARGSVVGRASDYVTG